MIIWARQLQMWFHPLPSYHIEQEYTIHNEAPAPFKSLFPVIIKQIIFQLNNS